MTRNKKTRTLELLYRAMKGEELSVKSMAEEYNVSTRSITRDITIIREFFEDNREIVSNNEIKYNPSTKKYTLEVENSLSNNELFAILKILIGTRAFSKEELKKIIDKMKKFTSQEARKIMEELIRKEEFHYKEVGKDCESVVGFLWNLAKCIREQREITVTYFKMSRELVKRKLRPIAISFSEYYFYLFAYDIESNDEEPHILRIDRIKGLVEHRTKFKMPNTKKFDEGELRKRIQNMFYGENIKIKFEYTGPSIQAILDKMPTAKVVKKEAGINYVEAEVYGEGVKMIILSQGSTIKVTHPKEFALSIKEEIKKMSDLY